MNGTTPGIWKMKNLDGGVEDPIRDGIRVLVLLLVCQRWSVAISKKER
jgi:hypothetical protein